MNRPYQVALEGRVCVITGAASGIGRATVSLFADNGAIVVAVDCKEPEAAPKEVRVRHYRADVSAREQVEAVVAATLAEHGRIDVLVNNAGVGFRGTVLETEEADWNEVMAVNAGGAFLFSRAVLPSMIEAGAGAIVNVASVGALVGLRNRAAYCASKGALAALTRALALDHVGNNIRVNAVAPGTIDTGFFSFLSREGSELETRETLSARQAMGRLGRPEEIARAILFLATEESSFITGSILTADGGMTAG